MLATVLSRAQFGMEAPQVCVEVHVGEGLPTFSVVGLPETVVRESRDRVRSAIKAVNCKFPAGRVTVNLAPADLPKQGGRFDLPIAIGVLVASRQIPRAALAGCEFYGELSLSGELRAVRGILPAVCQAVKARHRVVLPHANLEEAALVQRAELATAGHLLEVCAHVRGSTPLRFAVAEGMPSARVSYPDLADVRGQAHAKRALEIAAAGGHSLLFMGPPGAGKSMLAHRLPGILPPMTEAEALETASIASISALGFRLKEWRQRPFRAPHHTASGVALVGGGSHPLPGEISLAHNGVLFLDELTEFDRHVLEVLREPLETGTVTVSRAARQAEFPARFQLVAAMNPCPCGYLGDRDGRCHCAPARIECYRARISGPLLDRIDLHVDVPRVEAEQLLATDPGAEKSELIAQRVAKARATQQARNGCANSAMTNRDIAACCRLSRGAASVLAQATRRLGFSARAHHRLLKVARTIADLDARETIELRHLGEAIQLRRLQSADGNTAAVMRR